MDRQDYVDSEGNVHLARLSLFEWFLEGDGSPTESIYGFEFEFYEDETQSLNFNNYYDGLASVISLQGPMTWIIPELDDFRLSDILLTQPTIVPEPPTIALMLTSLIGIGIVWRRKNT